jgi:biopolymer transport protein ExbD
MRGQHHYKRRSKEPLELDMTTFLNLMVVLVPFLLITAVFSRITIVELNLPSGVGGASVEEPPFRIEVIVREGGLQLTDGNVVIADMPRLETDYDLAALSERVVGLKRQHPDANAASVLLEPDIEYDHLIQVMDAVRSASVPVSDTSDEMMQVALFTEISIGDAP